MKPRAVISLLVILAMVAPPGVLGIIAGLSSDARPPTTERDIVSARMQLHRASVALQAAFERTGAMPKSLAAVGGEAVSDPWGSPLWYCATTDGAFRLRSSGPDQKPGTRDDVFAYPEVASDERALTCERAQGPRARIAEPPPDRWAETRKQILRGTRAVRGLFG